MEPEDELSRQDVWWLELHDATYRFSCELRYLHKSNPGPRDDLLSQALNTLATELWDRCFGLTEITTALRSAADDLPRYAAGEEFRP